jgi:hypothetical protein
MANQGETTPSQTTERWHVCLASDSFSTQTRSFLREAAGTVQPSDWVMSQVRGFGQLEHGN